MEERTIDVHRAKESDDNVIAGKAAEYMIERKPLGRYKDEGRSEYYNRAHKYLRINLHELYSRKGSLAAYIVGAREARGDK